MRREEEMLETDLVSHFDEITQLRYAIAVCLAIHCLIHILVGIPLKTLERGLAVSLTARSLLAFEINSILLDDQKKIQLITALSAGESKMEKK